MKVRQEEDRVPGKTVTAVLAGILVITAVCVLVAWLITDCRAEALGPEAAPTPLEGMQRVPEEVNQMELTLFDEPAPALVQMELQEQRLHGYGWVSRELGVVHIPIERAMELYIEQQARPGGGAQPRKPALQEESR